MEEFKLPTIIQTFMKGINKYLGLIFKICSGTTLMSKIKELLYIPKSRTKMKIAQNLKSRHSAIMLKTEKNRYTTQHFLSHFGYDNFQNIEKETLQPELKSIESPENLTLKAWLK